MPGPPRAARRLGGAARPGARTAGAASERFSLAATARSITDAGRRDALRLSVEAEPTPEQLHRFHQRLRRARGALRLIEGVLPSAQSGPALEVLRRLRRVARLVGEVRDFDVAIAHLTDPRLAAAAPPPDSNLESAVRRMREEAHTGRALLGAFLRSEIARGLFAESQAIVEHAGPRLEGPKAWRASRDALRRNRAKVERALKRARRRPDPDRMHRLRMELRRSHILSDILDDAIGRKDSSFPARLGRLQRTLGALHDLDLLIDGLEDLGAEVTGSDWLRAEAKHRRAMRKELVAQLRKRSTRTAIASLSP